MTRFTITPLLPPNFRRLLQRRAAMKRKADDQHQDMVIDPKQQRQTGKKKMEMVPPAECSQEAPSQNHMDNDSSSCESKVDIKLSHNEAHPEDSERNDKLPKNIHLNKDIQQVLSQNRSSILADPKLIDFDSSIQHKQYSVPPEEGIAIPKQPFPAHRAYKMTQTSQENIAHGSSFCNVKLDISFESCATRESTPERQLQQMVSKSNIVNDISFFGFIPDVIPEPSEVSVEICNSPMKVSPVPCTQQVTDKVRNNFANELSFYGSNQDTLLDPCTLPVELSAEACNEFFSEENAQQVTSEKNIFNDKSLFQLSPSVLSEPCDVSAESSTVMLKEFFPERNVQQMMSKNNVVNDTSFFDFLSDIIPDPCDTSAEIFNTSTMTIPAQYTQRLTDQVQNSYVDDSFFTSNSDIPFDQGNPLPESVVELTNEFFPENNLQQVMSNNNVVNDTPFFDFPLGIMPESCEVSAEDRNILQQIIPKQCTQQMTDRTQSSFVTDTSLLAANPGITFDRCTLFPESDGNLFEESYLKESTQQFSTQQQSSPSNGSSFFSSVTDVEEDIHKVPQEASLL
ncbi:unnamed protein product [Soboliphyme baturini]|uniref:Protein aurora borealis n=1 Tax=Soboliphyme baturini TaxID=241478 RepID=A0A183IRN9_9BILA|nr:unnamed protein product [Soboliphyme baturini]